MRNTPTYTAQRRWMERARYTCVKRYGARVLLSDGAMLTFIPYGALPETLLASESEARTWRTETLSRGDPDTVLAGLEHDPEIAMTRQLDCLNSVTDTYHLLTDADGNPVASVARDLVALALPDPFDSDVTWRAHASPEAAGRGGTTVSAWRGDLLVGVFMSLFDTQAQTAFIVRRTPTGLCEQATMPATSGAEEWKAIERTKGIALGHDLLRLFTLTTPSAHGALSAIVRRQRSIAYPSALSAALAETLLNALRETPAQP